MTKQELLQREKMRCCIMIISLHPSWSASATSKDVIFCHVVHLEILLGWTVRDNLRSLGLYLENIFTPLTRFQHTIALEMCLGWLWYVSNTKMVIVKPMVATFRIMMLQVWNCFGPPYISVIHQGRPAGSFLTHFLLYQQ